MEKCTLNYTWFLCLVNFWLWPNIHFLSTSDNSSNLHNYMWPIDTIHSCFTEEKTKAHKLWTQESNPWNWLLKTVALSYYVRLPLFEISFTQFLQLQNVKNFRVIFQGGYLEPSDSMALQAVAPSTGLCLYWLSFTIDPGLRPHRAPPTYWVSILCLSNVMSTWLSDLPAATQWVSSGPETGIWVSCLSGITFVWY